jgi:hypothetical protein
MSTDVRTEPGFTVANPTRVVEGVWVAPGVWPYDVTPDGRRFVVFRRDIDSDSNAAASREIRVTFNWFEELRQRVPR